MRVKKKKVFYHGVLFFLFFSVSFLFWIKVLVSEKQEITVGSYQGLAIEKAIEQAKKDQLKPVIKMQKIDYGYFDTVVLEQDLLPQEKVVEGRKIEFTVSQPPEENWTNQWIGKPYLVAQKHFLDHGIDQVQKYQICGDDTGDKVTSLTLQPETRTVRVLVRDLPCEKPWVLKSSMRGSYLHQFEYSLNQHGIQTRIIGSIRTHDHLQTSPLSGSVVKKGDFVVIRKAL